MELHKTNEKSEPEKENGRIEIVITDPVVASINQILGQEVSSYSSDVSIYRVSEPLRSVKPEAYTPTVISIGPFHSSRKDLMGNKHKPTHLQSFLDLTKLTTNTIIETVKPLEKRARNCYAESIEMDSDEFVQLLVLDGCFIVMYLIGSQFSELRTRNTSNLWTLWDEIFCDLLLLENQLPFFLLQSLYDLCVSSVPLLEGVSFIEISRQYLIGGSGEEGLDFLERNVSVNICEVNHFVDFLRMHFTHTCSSKCSNEDSFFQRTFWPPTATELYQCGVHFRTEKEKIKKCAVDIAFKDQVGYLELPQIIIYDGFETRVRNLIAYEQCHDRDIMNEVSNFAVFMQYLVQTNQDVKLLIEDGVIQNNLGSVNEVTQIFNSLCKHVAAGNNFYNGECRTMKEYCKRRRHRWMTSLKHNYFSTPWACASSFAAILLLALTLVQTVTTIVALYK